MVRRNAIALLAVAILGAGCDLDPCENSNLRRIPSPDQHWVAWIFVRGCGATTGNSVQVSVLRASATAPSDGGNVFIIEQDSGVATEWAAPRELAISYEPRGEVFKQETQIGEVSVSYRER